MIAFLVIGGGGGYLFWRHRQRQLDLAATAGMTIISVEAAALGRAFAEFSQLAP